MERGFCEVSERCRSESTYSVGSLVIVELAHGHFDLGTVHQVQSTTIINTTVDEPQPLHRPNSSSCASHTHHLLRLFSVQVALQRLLALEKPVKVVEEEHGPTGCRNL